MGRGRGRPRRLAVMTPLASVHVFSSSLHTQSTDTSNSRKNPNPPSIQNPSIPLGTIEEEKADAQAEAEAVKKSEKLKAQPWVDIINGNRLPSTRKKIEYMLPKVVNGEIEVSIEECDVVYKVQFWENVVVMYVIGSNLSMNAVKSFINNVWNFVSMPQIYYNDEGYFIIRFQCQEDNEMVMCRGPYMIHRKPMFIHEWTADFTMKELQLFCNSERNNKRKLFLLISRKY